MKIEIQAENDDNFSIVNELQTDDSKPFQLLQNRPNPFDEATIIGVYAKSQMRYKSAWISIPAEKKATIDAKKTTIQISVLGLN